MSNGEQNLEPILGNKGGTMTNRTAMLFAITFAVLAILSLYRGDEIAMFGSMILSRLMIMPSRSFK